MQTETHKHRPLISSSGGFFYHYLAWRVQDKLWSHYKKNLNSFLKTLSTEKAKVALIGASGGYSLEKSWLAQFDEVLHIDPDPLAIKVFRQRFKSLHVVDGYKTPIQNLPFDLNDLKELNQTHLIVFCNLLGQSLIQVGATFDSHWESELKQALKTIEFISYHEIFSTFFSNNGPGDIAQSYPSISMLINAVISQQKKQEPLQLTQHIDKEFFDFAQKSSYFLWELKKKHFHFIEVVYHKI